MYQQFFGLDDEPFRLTPDPRYLFLSTKHAEALAHLRLGLSDSSGFVCITGDVGTGKTTLVRTFLSQLGPEVTAAYSLVPPLSATEMLRRVCREFGLPVPEDTRENLVDRLHAYLVEQRNAGRTCVLVLDEAQALSIELLEQIRLLLNLETETQKLLRIVLVGQPQLRKLLLDPELAQLNQRITLRWHLGPLSYRETAAYVSHRLAVSSGGRAADLFTVPALRMLHSVSNGIPRLINMIAHRALLAAFVAREVRVHRRAVARAYREIQVVPLPGTLTPARKAAWAVAGLVIGVGVVSFGAPLLDRFVSGSPADAPAVAAAPATHSGAAATTESGLVLRNVAPARPPADVPAAAPPVAAAAAPPAPLPVAAVPVAVPAAVAAVPAAAPQDTRHPPALGRSAPAPGEAAAKATSAQDLTRLLSQLDPGDDARIATDALLAAWGALPLGADETRLPADLTAVAWRRGLQDLPVKNDFGLLRTLDLPALVGLRAPQSKTVRYAALLGATPSQVRIAIGNVPVSLDVKLFQQYWSGEARVLWRDFNGVGTGLRWGTRGMGVVRLQELLVSAGALLGTPTGTFDTGTEHGVVHFQRAHALDPDGIVGPLTMIVLYRAVGAERPTLGAQQPGAS